MRLTTRGRYAVSAMLDLAMHGERGPVCLAAIARRRGISPAYLERLFRSLRRRGLVCSTRGAHGGYQLCRCAGEITVADVIEAVDESLDATACDGECGGLTHDLWAELTQHVQQFLETKTLAEICAAQRCAVPLASDELPIQEEA